MYHSRRAAAWVGVGWGEMAEDVFAQEMVAEAVGCGYREKNFYAFYSRGILGSKVRSSFVAPFLIASYSCSSHDVWQFFALDILFHSVCLLCVPLVQGLLYHVSVPAKSAK